MNFEQVMEQMKTQHEDQLRDMPLPPGAEEYMRAKVAQGDMIPTRI